MEVDDNKDENSEEKPGTSRDSVKNENGKDKKHDRDSDSQSSVEDASVTELKIKEPKPAHLGTKKMKIEKKVKKRRPVGRVEKRRKARGRNKRRSNVVMRMRARSFSTDDSRRSVSPQRPKCKYCGHRCCMQRNYRKKETLKKKKLRTSRKPRRSGKESKRMISECNQKGSRCAMLSPLFIKSNATPQDHTHTRSQPTYSQITPQMIHDSIKELTMLTESVPSEAILAHLQIKYPVNPNVEEAENELAEKLVVAKLSGIVWELPDDHWRLPTAQQKASVQDEGHVTLFWKMYADTMTPVDTNRKSGTKSTDTGSGSH